MQKLLLTSKTRTTGEVPATLRNFALNVTVSPGELITGKETYINHKIDRGTTILAWFAFGEYNPEANEFSLLTFEVDGVRYIYGCVIRSDAPAKEATKTEDLLSVALEVKGTWDALAVVGGGSVRAYRIDTRVIGLNADDVMDSLIPNSYDLVPFEDVITIQRAAGVTEFTVVKG